MVMLHRFNQGKAPRNSASSTRFRSACRHPMSPNSNRISIIKQPAPESCFCKSRPDVKMKSFIQMCDSAFVIFVRRFYSNT